MINIDLPNIHTPYYLLDLERLVKNFCELKKAFSKEWNNLIIGYSFKTNSLPWLLNWLKDEDAYAEVVSQPEYELAKKIGFKKIVFNGPYKGFEAMENALNNDFIVNLDSFNEIEWLKKNSPKDDKIYKVGLRINFDLEKYCHEENIMDDEPRRFGFNIENGSFEKAITELKNMSYIKIVGIHAHNSTRTKSLSVFNTISQKIIEAAEMIDNQLEYVDIGGSFFGDKPGTPEFWEYAKTICQILKKRFKPKHTALIIEPGASLIASPFYFVCKVVDKKDIKGTRILTVDGSCLNISPQMKGTSFKIDSNSQKKIMSQRQVIAGYTCIEKDRLGQLEKSNELYIDDILIFHNTGAYSMALSPNFIQYYPAVVVKDRNKFFYARKPWSIEEYMQKSILDDSQLI
ncbi:MAG: pyridoxal-dependent decarboxylase [Marinisporobacter sp.]|jgi:diaminopimelate decarboxylase|nr:pyridoxal-dependent decarboxylase [Marinisporobacter sp.]